MTIPQQKFREIVFQILYSYDIGHAQEEDMIELIMKELEVTKKIVRAAIERVSLIKAKQNEIDKLIKNTSQSYAFERIQTVEKNILRIGAFELLYDDQIPPKVAISEAMRLARKFSTPEAASFVNAVLDNLYKAKLGEQIDPQSIQKSLKAMEEIEKISEQAHNKNITTDQQDDEHAS